MNVSVRIPAILRSYTGGSAEVAAEPGILRQVIAGLDAARPGPAGWIAGGG
jgi:sulfur-carrier protein